MPKILRMDIAALIVIVTSGAWLIAVALLMALQPNRFLHLLSLTASSWRVNLTEQGLRLVAGAALVIRADVSKLPMLFQVGGWFVVASSVVLLLMPLRLHAAYAIWWSRKLTLGAVRAIAPVSGAFGAALVYAAF